MRHTNIQTICALNNVTFSYIIPLLSPLCLLLNPFVALNLTPN